MTGAKALICIWALGASALLTAACGGGGGSSSPAPASLSGDWAGTTQDSAAGAGSLAMQLAQAGQVVSGSWSVTYSNHNFNNGGDASGSVANSSVQMTFAPASPNPCMTQVTGSVTADARHMSGSYNNGNCPFKETGTFQATKQ